MTTNGMLYLGRLRNLTIVRFWILCIFPISMLHASDPAPADTVYPKVILLKWSIGANNVNFDMGGGIEVLYDRSHYSFRFIRGFEHHDPLLWIPIIEILHQEIEHVSPLETTHEYSILYGRSVFVPYGQVVFSGGAGFIQFAKRDRFIRRTWGKRDFWGLPTYSEDYETRSFSEFCLPYEVQYIVNADPIYITVSFFGNINRIEHMLGLNFNIAWGLSL